ncbi:hypothetical protein PACTADRAFT_3362 [Pachysolen tannophilus NRRL Y-2460]|uniref:U6 snRNA phosphodiesterase n=1 Tax=Pachysolen tannophilus NRRL Y-2460 TaxID=669874 RepID=A0A1E4TV63_PACTA|nr:hypothetical protein PACTADRAFT_3362 [Pachysolen tannophilus NRRL Y-2460]
MSYKNRPPTIFKTYSQIILPTNCKQRDVISGIASKYNESLNNDEVFVKKYLINDKPMVFDSNLITKFNNNRFNLHISLSHNILFNNNKNLQKYYSEVLKLNKFFGEEENVRPLNEGVSSAIEVFKKEMKSSVKVKFEPYAFILPDYNNSKIFLSLKTTRETNDQLKPLINFLNNLLVCEIANIKTKYKCDYDLDYLHSSIGGYTPLPSKESKFNLANCKYINQEIIAKNDNYRIPNEMLQQLEFNCNHFVISKNNDNMIRIKFP